MLGSASGPLCTRTYITHIGVPGQVAPCQRHWISGVVVLRGRVGVPRVDATHGHDHAHGPRCRLIGAPRAGRGSCHAGEVSVMIDRR